MSEVLEQIGEIIIAIKGYIVTAWDGLRPLIGGLIGGLSVLMFPTSSYATAAKALMIAMVLDIITKYVALSAENGGFMRALRNGVILSRSLWVGSVVKVFIYTVIGIMIGASYLLYASIPDNIPVLKGFMEEAIPFLGTIAYAVFFVREVQSSLENMNDFLIATKYNDVIDLGWLMDLMTDTETDLKNKIPKKFREDQFKEDKSDDVESEEDDCNGEN